MEAFSFQIQVTFIINFIKEYKISFPGVSLPTVWLQKIATSRIPMARGDSAWFLLLYLESDDKPNIWRMKKKERKDFRRKQDENYDLVHNLKQLYETIRRFVNLGI